MAKGPRDHTHYTTHHHHSAHESMSMSGTEQLPTRLIEELDVQKREEGGEQLPNLAGDMIGQGAMPEWYISPEQRSMK